MNCPAHYIDVTQCNCPVAEELIDLSGKQMSDGTDQEEADLKAMKIYEQSIRKQERLF